MVDPVTAGIAVAGLASQIGGGIMKAQRQRAIGEFKALNILEQKKIFKFRSARNISKGLGEQIAGSAGLGLALSGSTLDGVIDTLFDANLARQEELSKFNREMDKVRTVGEVEGVASTGAGVGGAIQSGLGLFTKMRAGGAS